MITVIKTDQFGVINGDITIHKSKKSLMGIGLFLYSNEFSKPLKYHARTDIIEPEARDTYDPYFGG